MNREAVLKRFKPGLPQEQGGEAAPSALEPSNWRQMERLVRSAIRSTAAEQSKFVAVNAVKQKIMCSVVLFVLCPF
jgi:hypothetical protein